MPCCLALAEMSLLTTIFVKLLGMLALAVSGTLLLLLPIPSFPSLWDRPVCTQELFITRRSRHSSDTRSIRLRVWAPMDPARYADHRPLF